MNTNLDLLFSPKSVAVIGASSNTDKWGNWIAEQVARHNNLRNVYFVNPTREVIYGIQSVASVAEIPEPLDVAVVAVPVFSFERIVDDLLDQGTKVIVGITSGFAEKNNKGNEREKRIVEKVDKVGSLLIGPNCAGVWDGYSQFHCLPTIEFTPGSVGLISQSGGIIADVYERLKQVCLGFSRVVSTGNQADVHLSDLIANFDADPNTKVIAMYIENEQSIPYHVFSQTTKPIVLLTPSTTPGSKKAARLHTNSILTNALIEEVVKINGAYFARTVQQFVALIQVALSGLRMITQQRVAIVTDSGGLGVMASAIAEQNNMVLDSSTDLINIISGFSTKTVELFQKLQVTINVDAILMILMLPNDPTQEYQYATQFVQSIKKPTVFICRNLDSSGAKVLLQSNVPVYRDVEVGIYALTIMSGA